MNIFISYRRDDSAATARLIHNELCRVFSDEEVFMDVEDIGWGDDFVQSIDERIATADVVLVIVGPRWAELLDRDAHGDDWVRHEVRAALARHARDEVRVVPVLVDGATMPAGPLPEDIAKLRRLNAPRFSARDPKDGTARLAEAIRGESYRDYVLRLLRERRVRRLAVAAGIGVFIVGWLSLFEAIGLDTRTELLVMRLAHALPGSAQSRTSGGVVIVAIDKEAQTAVGRPFDSTWRAEIARAIERIAAAGARTLVLDLTFVRPAAEDSDDDALERALKAVRQRMPVIVAVQDADPERGTPAVLARLLPLVSLGVACIGQRLSAAYTVPLVLRRGSGDEAGLQPSLGLAAYVGGASLGPGEQLDALALRLPVVRATDRVPATVSGYSAEVVRRGSTDCTAIQPGDFVIHQLLDARALPSFDGSGERVSFAAVLRADAAALRALQGRIVLVGLMAGSEDRHHTAGKTRYGVELIAAQVDALLRGAAIRPLPAAARASMMVALALIGAVVATGLHGARARWAWPAVAIIGALYVLGCVLWYRSEQQLIGAHYGLLALVVGTLLGRRMMRR